MIKAGIDYTPTTPSTSDNIKRLPNEHIPPQNENYIPFSPVSDSVSPYAEADYALAKPSPPKPTAELLQTVSNQLLDVQNKVNTVSNAVQTTTQNALNIATNTAQNVASNVADKASNVADKVSNTIMDVIEGQKPITSVLTDIISSEPEKEETKREEGVKRIKI